MKPQELDGFLKHNKMTGNELAAKLNVHWTTISRWRNGREPIPKAVELALKWVEGEERIEAIGQNAMMANTTNSNKLCFNNETGSKL